MAEIHALQQLEQKLNQVILGKPEAVRLALCCLLSEGHLLIEDLPGLGKTTLAHALALSLGLQYKRVQFTNDMLPGDLLGQSIFLRDTHEFQFKPGAIFSQILLADEINRASPRTQSALLEAMEEKQVSIDGLSYGLPKPFFVIATQNPLFHAGTNALPESQLDRFLMRLALGFPDLQTEKLILQQDSGQSRLEGLTPCLNELQLMALQQQVLHVKVSDALMDYLLALVSHSRQQPDCLPLSPRAAKALLRATKAFALLSGRLFATAEDVQQVFPSVAEHRLNPGGARNGQNLSQLLLRQVPCPL
ncbi:MoxR family ATPase [Rheinheimera sp.]|uniref:AAA family ATPase n=1 Tax=Rheinheimera sp. TaxID=1869214 RepID=UPI00261B41CE|nr:MoxR family ATPase [Rheinheimera sp.]MCA1930841.1 MoxR family ATPase [Rheinheimera sp.]